MTEKNRRFLIRITALVVLVLGLGVVAALGYEAGRRSMAPETPADTVPLQKNGEIDDRGPSDGSQKTDPGDSESIQGLRPPTPTSIAEENDTLDADPTISEVVGQSGPRLPVELENDDLEVLLEVWEIVDREFDGPLPENEEVLYAAIEGSLQLLNDDFTRFLPPEVASRSRERLEGSFEGIGAFVDINDDGFLVIVRPIEGQPADLAGIQEGDTVIQVDGQPIQGLAIEEIVALVKGPEGTEVILTIRREGLSELLDVTVVRDVIEIPIVESSTLEDELAYLRLTRFSSNATEQVEAALAELLADDPIGLILDLRDNPGGFLPETVEVADFFLAEGVILYQSDSQGEEKTFESKDGDLAELIPLVILINEGSASGSEIVAGAVQDRDRGLLIGQPTFGKGSVQQSHKLSDDSELRVTISRWYTPNGTSIDQQGIDPDISVENPEEFGGEDDAQLQAAIEALLSLD